MVEAWATNYYRIPDILGRAGPGREQGRDLGCVGLSAESELSPTLRRCGAEAVASNTENLEAASTRV